VWAEDKCTDGKPEAKCPLGKPWCRWKENIKIYLLKVGYVALTVFSSLSIGESSYVLRIHSWTFEFLKMRGISLLIEETLDS